MKVALVCDWLTNVGGAEKVLLRIHQMFPDAPIYTSQYDPKGIDWFSDADVRTGKLQKYPAKLRKFLGPLRQRYFNKLNLSEYDLVISVTGAEAKSVNVPNGKHICYCHVPTQYYWGMYDAYVKNPGFGLLNPLVRFFFKLFVGPLRKADLKSARKPDYYVTISEYSREQIKKYYGRDAVIIHPPVEIKDFKAAKKEKEDYFVVTSRQVNWKRIDLAIKACMMTQRHLVVIGEGPENKRLKKLAAGSKHIKFLKLMKKDKLAGYLAEAKGYIFPSMEPFGIAPVEALAAGCPVIAFAEGGARDYIKDGKNGVLFAEQTAKSLAEAIMKFGKMKFDPEKVSKSADSFDETRFDKELTDFINEKIK
ncbi:glycosyltransferase [Candidatus Saccharibacteria bacterium]|nr:glycosyltransferase [Candidatus Saccharibacteria bacterium]